MLRQPTGRQAVNANVMWGARRGAQARAAALRADAKQALERLAAGSGHGTSALLDEASYRLHAYCQYLQRELEPKLVSRGAFGALTASYLRQFERHWREELAQLTAHLERAPHSAGMARSAFVTAVMLIAELDAHGTDVASALRNDVVQA
jgi:hypothetical protein